jgi:outer membrane protein assembly factor BamB
VYISALDHSLIAVDKDTYKIVWHQDLGSAITSSPILASDGNLYIGSFTSSLEKFDPATGNHETAETTKDWVWSTPGEFENNLYFGDLSGNFYSYNIEQAKYNWTSTIKPQANANTKATGTAITANPVAMNDVLLVATESGAVYDVSKDGTLKNSPWATPGGQIYTSPVVAGNLVLVSPMNADSYLYAYDQNGRQVWAFKPAK